MVLDAALTLDPDKFGALGETTILAKPPGRR
jgi:hypothetical protein